MHKQLQDSDTVNPEQKNVSFVHFCSKYGIISLMSFKVM